MSVLRFAGFEPLTEANVIVVLVIKFSLVGCTTPFPCGFPARGGRRRELLTQLRLLVSVPDTVLTA